MPQVRVRSLDANLGGGTLARAAIAWRFLAECFGCLRRNLIGMNLVDGPADIFAWPVVLFTFQSGWIIGSSLSRFPCAVNHAVIIKEIAAQADLSVALTLHREREVARVPSLGRQIPGHEILCLQAHSIIFDCRNLETKVGANDFRVKRVRAPARPWSFR